MLQAGNLPEPCSAPWRRIPAPSLRPTWFTSYVALDPVNWVQNQVSAYLTSGSASACTCLRLQACNPACSFLAHPHITSPSPRMHMQGHGNAVYALTQSMQCSCGPPLAAAPSLRSWRAAPSLRNWRAAACRRRWPPVRKNSGKHNMSKVHANVTEKKCTVCTSGTQHTADQGQGHANMTSLAFLLIST